MFDIVFIINAWIYTALSVDVLVFSPLAIPFIIIKFFRNSNKSIPYKLIITFLLLATESIIVYLPWAFLVNEGIADWLVLLFFDFIITSLTLGPLLLIGFGIALIIINKFKKKSNQNNQETVS